VEQLIAECNTKRWPRLVDGARFSKGVKHLGTSPSKVRTRIVAKEIRRLLGKCNVISPCFAHEVPLRVEHVIHERSDIPPVASRGSIKD
jgi:hypothetical protein